MRHRPVVDQVVRRMAFCEAHPEVTVTFHRDTGLWTATYQSGKKGIQTITSLDLRNVLDELEKHYGESH